MATSKNPKAAQEETPEVQETSEEPERAVDPPEATDVADAERPTERQQVRITNTATLTLPSGASYLFNAGDSKSLQAEDAAFLVDQGYAVKVTEE